MNVAVRCADVCNRVTEVRDCDGTLPTVTLCNVKYVLWFRSHNHVCDNNVLKLTRSLQDIVAVEDT